MFQTLTGIGLLILGFLAADWIQLNGAGYIIAAIYLAVFTPLCIIEIVRAVRK